MLHGSIVSAACTALHAGMPFDVQQATEASEQNRTTQTDGRDDVAELDDDHAAHSRSASQSVCGGFTVSPTQRVLTKRVMHKGTHDVQLCRSRAHSEAAIGAGKARPG